jgi:hypothetical protein
MTLVAGISGTGGPSNIGKRQIGLSMYVKGKVFIGASILLRRQDDSEPMDYVALHLLCQGVEITLKGLLLLLDYDRFKPRLRSPLGHDLRKVAEEALAAHGLKAPAGALADELAALSNLYSQHLMRYGTAYDILVDPRTIPRHRVLRRIGAVIRLAERELKRG